MTDDFDNKKDRIDDDANDDDCPRRDFAYKAKFWGGTLVTRVYIKESTYRWNIQSVCQVGNDDVSVVCARKYEMVRMT